MNWGKSIVLVFILFAGFIGSLVFLMSRQQVDLVREDYYQTELAFQQQIDRVARTTRLKTAVMNYDSVQQKLVIALPDSLQKGEVKFYRPSNRRQDTYVQIQPNAQQRQLISTSSLAKGYWKVQLSWSDGQLDYFTEKELFIH